MRLLVTYAVPYGRIYLFDKAVVITVNLIWVYAYNWSLKRSDFFS